MNDEHAVAELLQASGKRPAPTEAFMSDVEENTRAAWQQVVVAEKKRRQMQWFSGVAAAACLVLTLVVALPQSSPELQPIASVRAQSGEVMLSADRSLVAGSSVATGQGQLTLELPDRTLIMLSANSELQLVNSAEIVLLQGQLFVDSPDHTTQVVIRTPFGDVTDIGTQYQITVSNEALQVAMREGITEINTPNGTLKASVNNAQGDVVRVKGQRVERSQIALDDASWQWVRQGYEDFQLQQASVDDLLIWASRVTAMRIDYANNVVAEQAQKVRFNGGALSAKTIENQLPQILQTANFSLQAHEGVWHIDVIND